MGGQVATTLELSLDELRERFQARTVVATLQCAGNRRADMQRVRPTSGDPWAAGAIGNAEWTGAVLRDVLQAAGAANGAGLHVAFGAADECRVEGKTFTYRRLNPHGEGVGTGGAAGLGDERGSAGARAWGAAARRGAGLRGRAQPEVASVGHRAGQPFGQPDAGGRLQAVRAGRDGGDGRPGFRRDHQRDAGEQRHLRARAARVAAGRETVLRGYATASDRAVVRVDVSADGGRTWTQAALDDRPDAPWSWCLWHAALDLPVGEHELAVRAWDEAGQTQPALPDDTWNYKGYLSAAWHRVAVVAS